MILQTDYVHAYYRLNFNRLSADTLHRTQYFDVNLAIYGPNNQYIIPN